MNKEHKKKKCQNANKTGRLLIKCVPHDSVLFSGLLRKTNIYTFDYPCDILCFKIDSVSDLSHSLCQTG